MLQKKMATEKKRTKAKNEKNDARTEKAKRERVKMQQRADGKENGQKKKMNS
ncbi:Uncharacterised protein [Candidatus Anstonella stagnisolia]|nr:Uncharacterised protein [Candidatus Anstonella stagnisolia]